MEHLNEEIAEFRVESLEMLDQAEASLLWFGAEGTQVSLGTAAAKAKFDTIFRCFHNLKGAAGMLDLIALQLHMHEIETALMKFSKDSFVPQGMMTYFLEGLDRARVLLAEGATGAIPPSTTSSYPAAEPSAAQSAVEVPLPLAVAGPVTIVADLPGMDAVAQEFFSEAVEMVERIARHLKQLDEYTAASLKPNSPLPLAGVIPLDKLAAKSSLDALYRDFHSLKGGAFLLNFTHLGEMAHLVESCLEPVREGQQELSSELMDSMYQALKLIEAELHCLAAHVSLNPEDLAHWQALASRMVQGPSAPTTAPLSVAQAPSFLPIADTPAQAALVPPTVSEPMKNVNALPVPSLALSPPSSPLPPPPALVPEAAVSALTSPTAGAVHEVESASVRVSVGLLDHLMTLVGEMVLVRNQVLQFVGQFDNQEFGRLSKRLSMVTGEIQDSMMKTRMQPIGNVLSKFNRLVRDLSRDLGKKIQLELVGLDTELDKSLLEAIKDPLTHIVRNSCDHGIEVPDIRLKAGKLAEGRISITTFHEGGQVKVVIQDDGKGLDPEALLRKGLEKGLITASAAKSMSEKEIFGLIFAPGFSTAAKITNVSGRGVGMDVVKTNIEKIGGAVELTSRLGKGMTLTLKIPLTLAILPALIIRSGEQEGLFAIPQEKLIELVRVDQSSPDNRVEVLQGSLFYRLRGKVLPLVSLNQLLRLEEGSEGLQATLVEQSHQASPPAEPGRQEGASAAASAAASSSFIHFAVLSAEKHEFGLIFDQIQDTADIVVKPLNQLLKSIPAYSGATILGDGSIALILDVLGISQSGRIGLGQASVEGKSKLEQPDQLTGEAESYLLVKLNSPTKHAFVLNYVQRLERFRRNQVEQSGEKQVIRYRNGLLYLVQANQVLGYGSAPRKPADDHHHHHHQELDSGVAPVAGARVATVDGLAEGLSVIVFEKDGNYFGIEVNEILDTLTTPLMPELSLTKEVGIFGNINTPAELVVVLDPFELIAAIFPKNERSEVISHTSAAPLWVKPEPGFLTTAQSQRQGLHQSLHILLVEDMVFFKKAIAAVLGKMNHRVTVVSDGREALERLKAPGELFDLMLSDIEMPHMNGFELAKAVRAGLAGPQYIGLPMMALSSKANDRFQELGRQAGFNLYLEKFKPDLVLAGIAALMDGKVSKRSAA